MISSSQRVLFETHPKFLAATAASIFFRTASLWAVPALGNSSILNLIIVRLRPSAPGRLPPVVKQVFPDRSADDIESLLAKAYKVYGKLCRHGVDSSLKMPDLNHKSDIMLIM
ncbi:hypothetical protein QN379_14300 [Glaciimonas sp. Gout2]|uniref:hypothetical protein n=1 Tax=Glaciimonas sp. Gout2 TaxID=3048625 RepID=UPI002B239CB8|nr:hypothetical protein [Glaciimonas sp. Gout2]MEB0083180.1 hypothetical protein [Glaciimonas sp. Gout2]